MSLPGPGYRPASCFARPPSESSPARLAGSPRLASAHAEFINYGCDVSRYVNAEMSSYLPEEGQITLHIHENAYIDTHIPPVSEATLNQKGMLYLSLVRERAKKPPDDTIKGSLVRQTSGIASMGGHMCTNLVVSGLTSYGREIVTSPILFYEIKSDRKGWVYTKNGEMFWVEV